MKTFINLTSDSEEVPTKASSNSNNKKNKETTTTTNTNTMNNTSSSSTFANIPDTPPGSNTANAANACGQAQYLNNPSSTARRESVATAAKVNHGAPGLSWNTKKYQEEVERAKAELTDKDFDPLQYPDPLAPKKENQQKAKPLTHPGTGFNLQ